LAIAIIAETAFRGDTVLLDITVRKAGVLADVSLSNFAATAKRSRANPDSAAVFQLTATNTGPNSWTQACSALGVVQAPGSLGSLTSPTLGVIHVRIAPLATAGLTAGVDADLQFDLEYSEPSGDVWTVGSGDILFTGEVTA
jgi:hypothetical protein